MAKLKWNTQQRLAYIESKAYYTGLITRSDVARTFDISDPAATKDLKRYNDLAPRNLHYTQRLFGFTPSDSFEQTFSDLAPAAMLALIANNTPSAWRANRSDQGQFSGQPSGQFYDQAYDQNDDYGQNNALSESLAEPVFGIKHDALRLTARLPSKEVLSQITRAIYQQKALKISYASLSKQAKEEKLGRNNDHHSRIIEPHTLVNTGQRWHVRAYNEDSFDFRDFVLSRFLEAELQDAEVQSSAEHDEEWMETLTLQFAPHPKLSPQAQLNIMADHGDDDGHITSTVRRAMIGYALQSLAVDTSVDHSLNPKMFHLVLINRDEVMVYADWALLT